MLTRQRDCTRFATLHSIDWQLVTAMLAYFVIGTLSLWSGSIGFALRNGGAYTIIGKQLLLNVGAVLIMFCCMLLGRTQIMFLIPFALVGGLIALVLPFFGSLGVTINGARRWIHIGSFTLQPSEIWKPVIVLYLASYLDKRRTIIHESGIAALPSVIIVFLSAFIIYFQNDFSTSILIIITALIVLFIANVSIKFVFSVVFISFLYGILMLFTSQYRIERLIGFLMQDQHIHTLNYQMFSALRAVKSGGLFGKGIGLGTFKLNSIPEVQSDFIFAAYAEETGFLGVLLVFLLCGFIVFRASKALLKADFFSRTAGFGLLSLFIGQVLLNLAVVTGVVPTTGLVLPFFSAGGTAVLMVGISCGLIINFARCQETATETEPLFNLKGVAHEAP